MSYQREFDQRLRVGVVGVGSHCYRNLLPAMNFLPVQLVALCDVDAERLERTACQFGVTHVYAESSQMYAAEKLEAVFLAVSPQLHPVLAVEAFRAGVHVWMEKPPAVRAVEVERMIAQRGDCVAVVGFKKAFMPALAKAREILSRPESGKLKTVLGEYSMDIPADGRAVLEDRRTTNWLANGCHPLSAMLAVGGRAVAVTTQRAAHGGGALLMRLESGALGNLHLASGMRGPTERYSFFAEGAHVVIENCLRVTHHRGIPFDYGRTTTYAPEGQEHGSIVWEPQNTLATLESKALFTQGMWSSMAHFCECVLAGRPATEGTLEFALHVMQVYEAALLSDGGRCP